uniref:Uncharacterized protein n=1 Tax=Zea mays TaxID=4577 RepID=B6UDA4_MAIZE|nr:hypothetical protein [Zea mays]
MPGEKLRSTCVDLPQARDVGMDGLGHGVPLPVRVSPRCRNPDVDRSRLNPPPEMARCSTASSGPSGSCCAAKRKGEQKKLLGRASLGVALIFWRRRYNKGIQS